MSAETPVWEACIREAERMLLALYAPTSLLVDVDLNVVHVTGEKPLSSLASGLNALVLFGEAAMLELRIALQEAKRTHRRVQRYDVGVKTTGIRTRIDFDLAPMNDCGDVPLFLLVVHMEHSQKMHIQPIVGPEALADGGVSPTEISAKPLMLVVDWSRKMRALFRRVADDFGFELVWLDKAAPTPHLPALAFLDDSTVEVAPDLGPGCQFVWMSRAPSLHNALKAVKGGALDYLPKPFGYEELAMVVERAQRFQHQVPSTASRSGPARGFIGSGPQMTKMFKTLARASLVASNVLILGETGTGKELAARAIHDHSARRNKAFVTVNCGALTETLLESELFGHVRGAFTGATVGHVGLFERASGGTIFLDEIGDVSPSLQVKLLHVLQEGEIRRVGGNHTLDVDVRVVAATHRDLAGMVEAGTFREDLYYRLRVLTLSLPPLRERLNDLPTLIEFFFERLAAKHGRSIPVLSAEAVTVLYEHRWPGNVRELQHALEQALVMSASAVLYPEDFPTLTASRADETTRTVEETPQDLSERDRIVHALKSTNYNKSRAADLLGISRVTLYRKVEQLKIS